MKSNEGGGVRRGGEPPTRRSEKSSDSLINMVTAGCCMRAGFRGELERALTSAECVREPVKGAKKKMNVSATVSLCDKA